MHGLHPDSTECGPPSREEMTVAVYGMQGGCKPFLEHARLSHLSERGARLDGIEHHPVPGDIVGVEYKRCQATARIVWVCERGSLGTEIGVQLLSSEPCPWQQDLGEAGCPALA
jgi:hypothetical protein